MFIVSDKRIGVLCMSDPSLSDHSRQHVNCLGAHLQLVFQDNNDLAVTSFISNSSCALRRTLTVPWIWLS